MINQCLSGKYIYLNNSKLKLVKLFSKFVVILNERKLTIMNTFFKWATYFFVTIFLINCWPIALHAQTSKDILEKTSHKFKTAKTIKANISFSMKNRNGVADRNGAQQGTFYLRGNSYRIETKNTHIITDGQSIWTYLIPNNEVQIYKYVASEQAISPSVLFSGTYLKDFSYQQATKKLIAGKNVSAIKLTPKTRQSFKEVDLYIDHKYDIVGGILYLQNGSTVEYTITNIQYNPTLSSDLFTFNTQKHKGVEVIDLR